MVTWDLVGVLLEELQHVVVGVNDAEAMREDLDDCADGEVLRSVELWLLHGGARLGDARALEELAADDARVAHGRLVDGDHVVAETVEENEATALVFRLRRVLQPSHRNAVT